MSNSLLKAIQEQIRTLTAAPGAATYEVVVTKLGTTVSVYARTGITTTSHRIDIPLRNGVHEIQVRAIRAENGQLYAGAWTSVNFDFV